MVGRTNSKVGERVRKTARHLTLSVLGTLAMPPKRPFLRALYFHNAPEIHLENFVSVIERLRNDAVFVDTDTCLAMLKASIPIERRCFHLSFDDGHRDFIRHTAPVLQRLKIPAMVFICTAHIGADESLLSWEDLRQLRSWGFEVGSHTRTHARLSGLSAPSQLEEEIIGSKRDIADRLGSECRYIAWPYGRKCDIHQAAVDMIAKAGYLGCFGGFRGSVKAGKTHPFSIPRHHLEANWPWKHIRYFAYGHWEE